jgi:hypothetical protein
MQEGSRADAGESGLRQCQPGGNAGGVGKLTSPDKAELARSGLANDPLTRVQLVQGLPAQEFGAPA